MQRSRRRVLELGGAALATGLAGCLGGGPGTDTAEPTGNEGTPTDGVEATPTTSPTATPAETATPTDTATPTATMPGDRPATDLSGFTEWFPAPSAIEFTGETGYAFLAIAPARLVELSDTLGDGATDGLTGETAVPGLDTLADASVVAQFARSGQLFEADFDRATAESDFEALGFSEADAYRGYTLFTAGGSTAGSGTRAAAVGDGAMVLVSRYSSEEEVDKRPAVEAVLDAKTGNAERYLDAVPDCARLVDALGNAHVLAGRTHETGATFDGATGEGVSTHVAESDSRVRASAVFAEGPDEDALAEWTSGAEAFHGQEPTTGVDGRVATAAALVPTGDLAEFPPEFPGPPIERDDPPATAPRVQFEFEYEETGDGRGLLTVTHYGGDTVAAEELFVRGSGFVEVADADQTSTGPWQGTASTDGDGVAAGDEVTVGVAADYVIRLVWETEDESATLAEDRGPDA